MITIISLFISRAGKLTFRIPLDLTSHLRDEKSFVVWRIALEHFEYLLKLFHGHKQINCVKVSYRHYICYRGAASHYAPLDKTKFVKTSPFCCQEKHPLPVRNVNFTNRKGPRLALGYVKAV